jgi:hypothetical protein
MLCDSNKFSDAKNVFLACRLLQLQEPVVRTQTLTQLQNDTIIAVYRGFKILLWSRRAFPAARLGVFVPRINTFPTRPELVIFLRLCLHNLRIQIFISQIRCNNKLVCTFLNRFMLTVGTYEFLCWRFSRRLCGLPGRDNDKDHSKQFQG